MNIKHTSMNLLAFMVSITRHFVLLLVLFSYLDVYAENRNDEVIIIVPSMVKPYQEIVESIQNNNQF